MKTKSLMIAGVLSMISAAAFAQTNPVAQVHRDNAQIRQDVREIHQGTREIKRDNAVIAAKQTQVAAGQQQLQAERGERHGAIDDEKGQADQKRAEVHLRNRPTVEPEQEGEIIRERGQRRLCDDDHRAPIARRQTRDATDHSAPIA